MSNTEPPQPESSNSRDSTEDDIPGILGCLGFLFQISLFTVIWLALCFLLFWKVGKAAAAIGFFVPPIAGAIWTMLSKDVDRVKTSNAETTKEDASTDQADESIK